MVDCLSIKNQEVMEKERIQWYMVWKHVQHLWMHLESLNINIQLDSRCQGPQSKKQTKLEDKQLRCKVNADYLLGRAHSFLPNTQILC